MITAGAPPPPFPQGPASKAAPSGAGTRVSRRQDDSPTRPPARPVFSGAGCLVRRARRPPRPPQNRATAAVRRSSPCRRRPGSPTRGIVAMASREFARGSPGGRAFFVVAGTTRASSRRRSKACFLRGSPEEEAELAGDPCEDAPPGEGKSAPRQSDGEAPCPERHSAEPTLDLSTLPLHREDGPGDPGRGGRRDRDQRASRPRPPDSPVHQDRGRFPRPAARCRSREAARSWRRARGPGSSERHRRPHRRRGLSGEPRQRRGSSALLGWAPRRRSYLRFRETTGLAREGGSGPRWAACKRRQGRTL